MFGRMIGKNVTVDDNEVCRLIGRRKYDQAIARLRTRLRRNPESVHLRQRLADVMLLAGKTDDALRLLDRLADEFNTDGFEAKAAAVLKRMWRIAPDLTSIEKRLIEHGLEIPAQKPVYA